jgi:hypothetical protein
LTTNAVKTGGEIAAGVFDIPGKFDKGGKVTVLSPQSVTTGVVDIGSKYATGSTMPGVNLQPLSMTPRWSWCEYHLEFLKKVSMNLMEEMIHGSTGSKKSRSCKVLFKTSTKSSVMVP